MTQTSQDRIREFKTRQVAYGPSLVANLHKLGDTWVYVISLWQDPDIRTTLPKDTPEGERRPANIVNKYVILLDTYNAEDPEELFARTVSIIGKWHCGRQYQRPIAL